MEKNVMQLTREDVEEVAKSTKEIIDKAFENLKNSATVTGESDPRFFFPNGIELIDVEVKVNSKEGIVFSVKVAGEKGLKGSLVSTELPEQSS